MEQTEGGSFLENMPNRRTPVIDDNSQQHLSFSGLDPGGTGARPAENSRNQLTVNGEDWSVVNAWCRENLYKYDQ